MRFCATAQDRVGEWHNYWRSPGAPAVICSSVINATLQTAAPLMMSGGGSRHGQLLRSDFHVAPWPEARPRAMCGCRGEVKSTQVPARSGESDELEMLTKCGLVHLIPSSPLPTELHYDRGLAGSCFAKPGRQTWQNQAGDSAPVLVIRGVPHLVHPQVVRQGLAAASATAASAPLAETH